MAEAKTKLKVYKWDVERAKKRLPMSLLLETNVLLPVEHDAARVAAGEYAQTKFGGRIRGCSALAGAKPGSVAGYTVTIELG